jgi:hypothetical protein
MDLIVVAVATFVALLAVCYTFILSSLDEIKKNWVQYRCNPVYMPFASLVGVDTAGNFMRCTTRSFQDYAGFIFDPINRLFSTFLEMFSSIADSLNSMRAMFNGIRTAFLGIVTMIFGKLANTIASMQYLMIRIRTVFLRVSAVMYSMLNIMNTGISSGKSVLNGPIGKTISFLCFAPETRIKMADGTVLGISDVEIGDVMEGGDTVTGLYVVTGNDVQLFRMRDVLVSGSHRLEDGIRVDEHPDAIFTSEKRNILMCLDTDTGFMTVGGQKFRDFEFESHENPLSAIKLGDMSTFDYLGIAGLRKRGSTWEVLVY